MLQYKYTPHHSPHWVNSGPICRLSCLLLETSIVFGKEHDPKKKARPTSLFQASLLAVSLFCMVWSQHRFVEELPVMTCLTQAFGHLQHPSIPLVWVDLTPSSGRGGPHAKPWRAASWRPAGMAMWERLSILMTWFVHSKVTEVRVPQHPMRPGCSNKIYQDLMANSEAEFSKGYLSPNCEACGRTWK